VANLISKDEVEVVNDVIPQVSALFEQQGSLQSRFPDVREYIFRSDVKFENIQRMYVLLSETDFKIATITPLDSY